MLLKLSTISLHMCSHNGLVYLEWNLDSGMLILLVIRESSNTGGAEN